MGNVWMETSSSAGLWQKEIAWATGRGHTPSVAMAVAIEALRKKVSSKDEDADHFVRSIVPTLTVDSSGIFHVMLVGTIA